MSKKFHINNKDQVLPCSAETKCPYGGSENHFATKQEAIEAIEERASDIYSKPFHHIKKEKKSDTTLTTGLNNYIQQNFDETSTSFINSFLPVPEENEKQSTEIVERYKKMRKELLNKAMPEQMSAQTIASQLGNTMELVIEHNLTNDPNFSGSAIKGKTVETRVKNIRTTYQQTGRIDEKEIKELCSTYHVNPSQIRGLVKSKKSIQFPDIIIIDKDDATGKPVVRVTEMKTSGQNDSSAVPKNIDKMRFDTENSAVQAWKDNNNIILERAVSLIATRKNAKGKFENQSTWQNSLIKRNVHDVQVLSNEEAFSWMRNRECSEEEYSKNVIDLSVIIKVKQTAHID